MGTLDDLLSGAGTVGKTALQVPQAVGGGALDILIGDRTNVPAGEQVKRSIEALLLSGDNPANLIAIHHMNAQKDAANEAVINTPEFRRTMSIQQTAKNLTPEQAFDATAQLYGVSGYRPPMAKEAVDLAPGGPSAPEQQNVPQLAPLGAGALAKDMVAQTKLGAMTQGSDLDQLLARYKASQLDPPIDVQRGAASEALKGDDALGLTQRTVQWKGGQLAVTSKELTPDEQFFADETRAKDAAHYQNKYREAIGDPVRVGLAQNPAGGFSLLEMHDPSGEASAKVTGAAAGKQTAPAPGLKSEAQLEADKAAGVQGRRADTAIAKDTRREASGIQTQLAAIEAAREQLKEYQTLLTGPGSSLRPEPFAAHGDDAMGLVTDIADKALYGVGQKAKLLAGDQRSADIKTSKLLLRSILAQAIGGQGKVLSDQEQAVIDAALADNQSTIPSANANLKVLDTLIGAKERGINAGRVLTTPDTKGATAAAPPPEATPGPATRKVGSKTYTVEY